MIQCHRCQTRIPHQYCFAGPHIKEVCGRCGSYIRFAPIISIPNHLESRKKIWEATQDTAIIEEEKRKTQAPISDLHSHELARNIYWNNVYVNIVKNHFT